MSGCLVLFALRQGHGLIEEAPHLAERLYGEHLVVQQIHDAAAEVGMGLEPVAGPLHGCQGVGQPAYPMYLDPLVAWGYSWRSALVRLVLESVKGMYASPMGSLRLCSSRMRARRVASPTWTPF